MRCHMSGSVTGFIDVVSSFTICFNISSRRSIAFISSAMSDWLCQFILVIITSLTIDTISRCSPSRQRVSGSSDGMILAGFSLAALYKPGCQRGWVCVDWIVQSFTHDGSPSDGFALGLFEIGETV